MTPLIWSPTSRRDIARITIQLMAVDPVAARKVAIAIRASSWRLREFPLSAPAIGNSGARKLVVSGLPYVLIYRLRGGVVDISRVRHAHEDWAPR